MGERNKRLYKKAKMNDTLLLNEIHKRIEGLQYCNIDITRAEGGSHYFLNVTGCYACFLSFDSLEELKSYLNKLIDGGVVQ